MKKVNVYSITSNVTVQVIIDEASTPSVAALCEHPAVLDLFDALGSVASSLVTINYASGKVCRGDNIVGSDLKIEDGMTLWFDKDVSAEYLTDEAAGGEEAPAGEAPAEAPADQRPHGTPGTVVVSLFGGLVPDITLNIVNGVTTVNDIVNSEELQRRTRMNTSRLTGSVVTVNDEIVELADRRTYQLYDGDEVALSTRVAKVRG